MKEEKFTELSYSVENIFKDILFGTKVAIVANYHCVHAKLAERKLSRVNNLIGLRECEDVFRNGNVKLK